MKKAASIIVIIASILIIQNLASSILNLWQKRDVVTSARTVLEKERAENQKLKSQLAEAEKSSFIEQEARNKLFLSKPGESQIILPQASNSGSMQSADEKRSNLELWIDLFFGS